MPYTTSRHPRSLKRAKQKSKHREECTQIHGFSSLGPACTARSPSRLRYRNAPRPPQPRQHPCPVQHLLHSRCAIFYAPHNQTRKSQEENIHKTTVGGVRGRRGGGKGLGGKERSRTTTLLSNPIVRITTIYSYMVDKCGAPSVDSYNPQGHSHLALFISIASNVLHPSLRGAQLGGWNRADLHLCAPQPNRGYPDAGAGQDKRTVGEA